MIEIEIATGTVIGIVGIIGIAGIVTNADGTIIMKGIIFLLLNQKLGKN